MLKKGIINDLARVTHSLDLSSPNVAATVNAVLKPLETLSRIVNQPTGLGPGAQRGGSKNKTGSGGKYLLNNLSLKYMVFFKSQLRDPQFFQNCGHFQ